MNFTEKINSKILSFIVLLFLTNNSPLISMYENSKQEMNKYLKEDLTKIMVDVIESSTDLNGIDKTFYLFTKTDKLIIDLMVEHTINQILVESLAKRFFDGSTTKLLAEIPQQYPIINLIISNYQKP